MKEIIKVGAVAIILISIIGVVRFVAGSNMTLETRDHDDIKIEGHAEATKKGISTVSKDFKHFVGTVGDFINYAKTGDEKYARGLEDVRGEDPLESGDIEIDAPNSIKEIGGVWIKNKDGEQQISEESLTGEQKEEGAPGEKRDKVTLVRVVDGDTIIVKKDGEEVRVRFIGIDTPESVNPDKEKNNEYGKIASNYTKSLLFEGDTLYLEYDKEPTDKYGRTLAYIWQDETSTNIAFMINAQIIGNGYADVITIKPNTKYAEQFKIMRDNAKKANVGLWADEGYRNLVGE